MTTAREVLQLIITGDGQGAVAEMKRVGMAARTELGAAEKHARMASTTMMAMGGAAVAAGAGVLFGLKQTTDAYASAGRETMKLQRLTGGTAEDMSRLRYVAEMTGVGVDALGTAVIRLSKSSESSGGKGALEKLGVSLVDAEGKARPVVDILGDLAGRFEAMPNGLEKNSTALKLFGRSGADLIPLLNRGAAGIDELVASADKLGLTLSEDDVARVKEYTIAQRELAQAREALMMQVGQAVFPALLDGTQTASNIAGAAAQGLESLPDSLKEAGGALASYGSAGVVAVGATALLSGASQKAVAQLKNTEGSLNRAGVAAKGFGVILAGIAGIELVSIGVNNIGGFDRRQADEINAAIAAAGDGQKQLEAFTNATLEESKKIKLTDGFVLGASYLGIFGQALLDLPGAEKLQPLAEAQTTFDMLLSSNAAQATATLDAYEAYTMGLDRNSDAYRTNMAFIADNRKSIALSAAANDQAVSPTERLTLSLNRLDYSFGRVNAGAEDAEPGVVQFADSIGALIDPVLALADANNALEDAQARMAEAASTNGKDVRDAQRGVEDAYRSVEQAQRSLADSRRNVLDATRDLSDAQRELNEVLADDPMFGLTSVSPEEEIADARSRLAEANRRLAANPGDGFALAMRDEALMDMERAVQRRQDMARDGEQRAEQVEQARRSVEDAQRGLEDAQRGVGDAERGVMDARQGLADAQAQLAEVNSQHGLNSEEYERAALDVIRATLDVQNADAQLAEFLEINGIDAVGKMITELDRLIAQGGPVGEAAAQMKAHLQPLVEQALVFASAMRQVNAEMATTAEWQAQWDALFGGYNSGGRRGGGGSFDVDGGGRRIIGVNPSTGTVIYEGRAASGGRISGAGSGTSDSIPMMLSNGEWVIKEATAAKVDAEYGPGAMAHFNATGQLPVRMPSSRLPGLPGAGRGAGGSSVVNDSRRSSSEGDIMIEANITQVVREPVLAGAAVVGELRQIAHRSGRGLAVSERIR